MKAVGKRYTLLKYSKSDLDIVQKVGLIYLVNNVNAAQYICSTATVHSTNHTEIKEGDTAIVSYRIAHDVNANDPQNRLTNQYYIESDDEGNEIRYCETENDIFGVVRDGKILPLKKYLFCELPELVEERTKGGLIIPESFRNQKTDKGGYWAKVKAAHPEHNLKAGVMVYCEVNSDIMKEVNGEKMLCIPIQKVCGKLNSDKFIPIAK